MTPTCLASNFHDERCTRKPAPGALHCAIHQRIAPTDAQMNLEYNRFLKDVVRAGRQADPDTVFALAVFALDDDGIRDRVVAHFNELARVEQEEARRPHPVAQKENVGEEPALGPDAHPDHRPADDDIELVFTDPVEED